MKYETLFFDADNTLFDYDLAERKALENTFTIHNIPFNGETKQLYKVENDKLWQELEQGLVTKEVLRVKRFEILLETLQIPGDAGLVSDTYVTELGKGTYLLPGAEALCKTLAERYQIIIMTNGIQQVQDARISNSLIAPYITKMFTSEGVGYTKPDKRFFEHAIEELKIADASKILMIGDSLSADIKGAMNSNLASCWFNPHQTENNLNENPTYEITSLEAILDIV